MLADTLTDATPHRLGCWCLTCEPEALELEDEAPSAEPGCPCGRGDSCSCVEDDLDEEGCL